MQTTQTFCHNSKLTESDRCICSERNDCYHLYIDPEARMYIRQPKHDCCCDDRKYYVLRKLKQSSRQVEYTQKGVVMR